jgi:Helix-turn-helix domain
MTRAPIALADLGDILTPRDVQHILGIGRNATYELLASGRLQSVRVTPRRLIVTKKALEAFLGVAANMPPAGTP